MAKKQFCYYGASNGNNNPSSNAITTDTLHNGVALAYTYPIIKLNIESLPGTKFYLNGNSTPFIIDNTGIFNLPINNTILINSIIFDETSLTAISTNGYLIINYETLD